MANNYVVHLKLTNITHYNTEATFQYKRNNSLKRYSKHSLLGPNNVTLNIQKVEINQTTREKKKGFLKNCQTKVKEHDTCNLLTNDSENKLDLNLNLDIGIKINIDVEINNKTNVIGC